MHSDESADILGGRIQVSPPRPPLWSDPGRMALLLGFVTVAAIAWVRIAPHYRQWRETRYRKAMRRRHGIPDDDHRPFNVAYAAALQARKKREGRGTGARQAPPEAPMEDGQQFPLRPSDAMTSAAHIPPPVGTSSGYQNGYASASLNPGHHSRDLPTAKSLQGSTLQHPSRAGGGVQGAATRTLRGKHALDDETDVTSETLAKKSRVEGEEVVDEAEAPEWQSSRMNVEQHAGPTKRGSKRVASIEDDEGLALSRADRRDKRARKVSIDKSADASEDGMDEDELEDDLEDFPSNVRGKKRDRAEAGSTFGGEDSIMDDDEKPQRQRRRRVVSNKLSQSLSRGQKRVRDLDSYDSNDSEVERPKREPMRKKRGKRSDEDAIPVSNDPLCKGRRIGEEWEANGVRYKVGPNGQRLRQELVKKSRSRFPMPSDSQHPDRRANVDVYVETWLTEEEYLAAKERHELAWQDAPPSPEPQNPTSVPDSPSKAGKNLLWSSTMASRESPAKRGSLRQSITGNPLRLSVLAPSPVTSSRRISTVYQVPASPASDSPKLQKSKSYSKWEKQDLEAAAMSKIREKQQHQAKVTSLPTSTTTPGSAATSFGATSAPTTANQKPETAPQPSMPSFGFAPAPTSAQPSKPAAETPKLNVPSSNPATAPSGSAKPAAPLFPFPSSSASGGTPTSTTPAAPAMAPSAVSKPETQASASVPNFFAKPSTTTPAAPSTSSTSIPNFFAKPAGQGTASGTNAASTTPATSQASTAPKSTFSFAPTPATAQPQTHAAPATNGSAKPEEPKSIPGGSLLSRLGMGPPPVAPSPATFAFAKPGSAAPSAASGTPSDAAKSASGTAAPEPPKFSFGAPSKPANPTPATNGATATAPSSAAAATGSGTSTPKFSFGVNNASSQPAASNTSTGTAANPFQGGSAANGSNAPAAKSAFSFGNSSTSASSPFGSNSNASNPSPFGATSSTVPAASPFGAAAGTTSSTSSASPFGAASGSTKPAEAPKSAFAFGNPAPAASNTSTSTPAEAPKSAFSFGNPTTPASNASTPAEAPKPAFSFGNNSASSSAPSIFGGASGAQSSSAPKADAPAAKSAFSFGSSSSTPAFGSSSTPTFGASSTPSTASPFGSATTAPAFGASSTAPAFGTSSSTPAFGSGASSGTNSTSKPTFSFGTPAGNNAGSSATPAAGSTVNKTENKPFGGFGFGASNTNGSNNASTPAASSPFGFGAQPSSNNASTPAASSPFGNAQQGSGSFGFGASSGSFSFGSSSNAGQNTQK
ncbi:hypothetical protein GY45DRAFT_1363749 [Cubamyces sp. BRFM 1775]|nr:hypothetical protein GY45DRAFT_1363749 [Cubamyces sp. BRFM 1775]